MKYSAYPNYKESNIEWLDILPQYWMGGNLRWFANIYSGGTPSKNVEEYWYQGTVPWLNSGAVNNPIINEPSAYITEDALNNSSAKWIPCNALVMALAGQGKTKATVAQLGFKTTCNQSMAAIVPNQHFNPRFLYWWLNSNYQNIRNMAGGDLRDGLNLELIGSIQCPIPEEDEQTQIVTFLDNETAKIDQLIEKQQQLIKLLEEKRQAVISHTVTKGLNPDVPMKDSGIEWLGKVPDSWITIKFGLTHLKADLGGNYPASQEDEGLPLIKMGNLDRGRIKLKKLEFLSQTEYYDKNHLLVKGDFLFNTRNSLDLVGKVSIWREELNKALYNSNILRITYNRKFVSSTSFMSYLFNSTLGLSLLRLIARGTTNVAAIYYKDLRTITFALPPLKDQEKIAEYLDQKTTMVNTLINKVDKMIVLMKERRTALISSAVTGKIDVRNNVSVDSNESTTV